MTSSARASKPKVDATQLNRHELGEAIFQNLRARYDIKEQILGAEAMRYHERIVMLSVLDGLWKDHLLAMDHLKEGIGPSRLRPTRSPCRLQERVFRDVRRHDDSLQEDTARHLFRMQIIGPDGTPIESAEQLASAQAHAQALLAAQAQQQLAGAPTNTLPPSGPPQHTNAPAARQNPPVSPPNRAPSTTIDALEREFQKKKQRELEQAAQSARPQPPPTARLPATPAKR